MLWDLYSEYNSLCFWKSWGFSHLQCTLISTINCTSCIFKPPFKDLGKVLLYNIFRGTNWLTAKDYKQVITHAQCGAWVVKWALFLRFGVTFVHANLCLHTFITIFVFVRHIGFFKKVPFSCKNCAFSPIWYGVKVSVRRKCLEQQNWWSTLVKRCKDPTLF